MLHTVAERRLRLYVPRQDAPQHLLLVQTPPHTQDANSWMTRCALLVYAAYRTFNTAHHKGPMQSSFAEDAIREAIHEGSKGHSGAMRCVDTIYSN